MSDATSTPNRLIRGPRASDWITVLEGGPLLWAAGVAHGIAGRIADDVVVPAGGELKLAELRGAVEALVVQALTVLAGDRRRPEPPEEVRVRVQEYAARAIPLERVLASLSLAHGLLGDALLDAALAHTPAPLARQEARRVAAGLHAVVAEAHRCVLDEYRAVHERWHGGAGLERAALVDRVLESGDIPAGAASAALGYPLHRHHLALVVDRVGDADSSLHLLLERWMAAVSPAAVLIVPRGSRAWLWTAWRTSEVDLGLLAACRPAGLVAWAGVPGPGLAGFRASHREAVAATAVVPRAGIVDFRDVELDLLLGTDADRARTFVERHLGALAAGAPRAAELRATLLAYLESERSLSRTAARLHIARNTVSYRVRQATELLGRQDLSERRLELECALRLAARGQPQ